MPNKQRQLAEVARVLGRGEEEILIEALEKAGSIDGAAELLSKPLGARFWPNSVRNEISRFGLQFTREIVGRVEKVAANE